MLNDSSFDSTPHPSPDTFTRRRWLRQLALGFGAIALFPHRAFSSALPKPSLFEGAEFAYISPMQSNGDESTCHGEVWFAWIDDRVVIVTARDSWKAKALAAGLSKTYLWVGNYGRWKGWFGRRNTLFQAAPRLVGRAAESRDPKLLDRLLAQFAVKYPHEFNDWAQEQREGFHENRRTLIVYELADVTSPARSLDAK